MVKVLFFARLREQFGRSELPIEPSPSTAGQLLERLRVQWPDIDLTDVMIAVNEQLADGETPLADGDAVALLPPVSGG